ANGCSGGCAHCCGNSSEATWEMGISRYFHTGKFGNTSRVEGSKGRWRIAPGTRKDKPCKGRRLIGAQPPPRNPPGCSASALQPSHLAFALQPRKCEFQLRRLRLSR